MKMNSCDLLRVVVGRSGFLEMEVMGNSMAPFLLPREKVLLQPVESLGVGDIVVHPGRRSGWPVLHRAISVTDSSVRTMGDNSFMTTEIDPRFVVAVFSAIWSKQLGVWCKAPLSAQGSFELADITVPYNRALSMESFALGSISNPPSYNAASYNCQSFVNSVLAAGNVVLGKGLGSGNIFSYAGALVPNEVYEGANLAGTSGVLGLQKVVFSA